MASSLFPLGYFCVSDEGGGEEGGERDMFTYWCAVEPIELEGAENSTVIKLNST